jgi:hypothetical protein
MVFGLKSLGDFAFGGTRLKGSGARQGLSFSPLAAAAVVAIGGAVFSEIFQ